MVKRLPIDDAKSGTIHDMDVHRRVLDLATARANQLPSTARISFTLSRTSGLWINSKHFLSPQERRGVKGDGRVTYTAPMHQRQARLQAYTQPGQKHFVLSKRCPWLPVKDALGYLSGYRGTWPIIERPTLGLYGRPMPRAMRWT